MKIIFEEPEIAPLTFSDVADDQMFVDIDGCLCMKVDCDSYIMLVDECGKPYAFWKTDFCGSRAIKRILPKISKIEF